MLPAQQLLLSGGGSGGGYGYDHYHPQPETEYWQWRSKHDLHPELPPRTDVEAVFLKLVQLHGFKPRFNPLAIYNTFNTIRLTYNGQKLVICTEPLYRRLSQANHRADMSRMAGFYSIFNSSFVKKKTAQRAALDAVVHEPVFHGERDPSTGAIIITTQHGFRLVVWTDAEFTRCWRTRP